MRRHRVDRLILRNKPNGRFWCVVPIGDAVLPQGGSEPMGSDAARCMNGSEASIAAIDHRENGPIPTLSTWLVRYGRSSLCDHSLRRRNLQHVRIRECGHSRLVSARLLLSQKVSICAAPLFRLRAGLSGLRSLGGASVGKTVLAWHRGQTRRRTGAENKKGAASKN